MRNPVVIQCRTVFKFVVSKQEPLLVNRNAFLFLHFFLDILDCIVGIDIESNLFVLWCSDVNLHWFELQNRLMSYVTVFESRKVVVELF